MCNASAPELEKIYLAYKDQGVLFLGTFYMSKKAEIKKFAEQFHITFPVGKALGISRKFRVETIPELIFLSREGKITKRIIGKVDPQEVIDGVEMILQ